MDIKELVRSVERSSNESAQSLRDAVSDGVYDAIESSQKELEKKLDVDNFTVSIKALPEKIRIQSEVYKEARTAFEAAKSDIVNAESMLMAVITSEENDKGKPRYSNEATRKAELEIRKKEDDYYLMAWEPYKAALDEMENAQFKLDQLSNEFRAFQTVGGLLVARLSLMRLNV
jgi:hypothetical protein